METTEEELQKEITSTPVIDKISRLFSSALIIIALLYVVYYFVLFIKGSNWQGNALIASILFNSLLIVVGVSLIYYLVLLVLWLTKNISPGEATKFFLGTITALLFVALLLFSFLKWNGL